MIIGFFNPEAFNPEAFNPEAWPLGRGKLENSYSNILANIGIRVDLTWWLIYEVNGRRRFGL